MMRHDPYDSPRMPVATERLSGTVSWFSAIKGFGFVRPADGTEDIFIHASVVQQAGASGLREGSTIQCDVAPGKKGRQVVAILSIDESTASLAASHERPRNARPLPPLGDETLDGIVKWFNATKGFGFITPDRGGKDVFLHASVLRRAGLTEVEPGQRVRYSAVDRDKGPEARSLELVDSPNY